MQLYWFLELGYNRLETFKRNVNQIRRLLSAGMCRFVERQNTATASGELAA